MTRLTRVENRLLQAFLHLQILSTADVIDTIVCGRKKTLRIIGEYMYRFRRKIETDGLTVDMTRVGGVRYALRRTVPQRDRAAYMRNYKAARRAGSRGA